MNYPNGKAYLIKPKQIKNKRKLTVNAGNRGMAFEEAINISNEYYKYHNLCLITKRPTPINVVKVDYTHGARITDAYFEKQSTTDYNGVYQGKYIDFEAKNTRNKTSFPLANISSHQIEHLSKVIEHGGIAFFLIQFEKLNEVYLLDAIEVINNYRNGKRKSIPYSYFISNATRVETGISPRINYLKAVIEKYFKK